MTVNFRGVAHTMQAWRDQHIKDTGHQVWLHARGFEDIAMMCFTCRDNKELTPGVFIPIDEGTDEDSPW